MFEIVVLGNLATYIHLQARITRSTIDGVLGPGTTTQTQKERNEKAYGTDAAAMDWLPVTCVT